MTNSACISYGAIFPMKHDTYPRVNCVVKDFTKSLFSQFLTLHLGITQCYGGFLWFFEFFWSFTLDSQRFNHTLSPNRCSYLAWRTTLTPYMLRPGNSLILSLLRHVVLSIDLLVQNGNLILGKDSEKLRVGSDPCYCWHLTPGHVFVPLVVSSFVLQPCCCRSQGHAF